MDNIESGMILDVMKKLFGALKKGFELLDGVEVSKQTNEEDGTISLDLSYQDIPFSVTVDLVDDNLDEANVTITCLDREIDFKPITELVKSATPDAVIDTFKQAIDKFFKKEEQQLAISSIKLKLEKDGNDIIHAHTYSVKTTYIKADELINELAQSDEFIESIPEDGDYYEVYEDGDDIVAEPYLIDDESNNIDPLAELLKLEYRLWAIGQMITTAPGQFVICGDNKDVVGDRALWEAKSHIDRISQWLAGEVKLPPNPFIVMAEANICMEWEDNLEDDLMNTYRELLSAMNILSVNLSQDKSNVILEWADQLDQYIKFTLDCQI